MIIGTYVPVYFLLVVNKSSYCLFGRENITVVIKTFYKRNDLVMKTLVLYMCEIKNYRIMKNISALCICMHVYVYVCEYLYL